MGFVPEPQIALQSGLLYNVVVDLLVCLGCYYTAYVLYVRVREKKFSLFLLALGSYWLVVGWGNSLLWLNHPFALASLAYLLKFLFIIPAVALMRYLSSLVFENKTSFRRITALYNLLALVYLFLTFQQDGTLSTVTYWGIQWQTTPSAQLLYLGGMLLPVLALALYLLLRRTGFYLSLGAVVFVLLEYTQLSSPIITWQRLLARLLYILIAFGAYLYFMGRVEEKSFVPRGTEIIKRKPPRLAFFAKLFFLFILLSIVPITISSLLMFVSFKEIIDLYIYKPLLWNLKTSREAFLLALTHVQIQALFLMILTGTLVVVASIAVSRGIAESLRRISAAMGRVSRGDFSFELLPDSNDEIGDVVNYFNNMSAEIKRARDVMENWNRELEVKVRERTEDLRILFDVSKAIGSSLDLELLIGRALSQLLPLLQAENFSVLIPDEKGVYQPRISHGLENLPLALIPSVAGKNEISLVPSAAIVPLRAKGKTMGILVVGSANAAHYSQERELNLLTTIADQLAIAIENVGIYEKEKEAVARLTELDRLKNEFISMVSHELRTPVTSADGYVSLFLTGVTGSVTEDQKKYLTIIKENNQRLLALINRLLDFSRIETGRFSVKRELISINEVVQAAAQAMKLQLERKHATLKLKLDAQNINFMGDKEKMAEVFVNLIENALKFSREDVPGLIEVSTRDAQDFIEVAVSDNGMGIESQYLEKIFNKFYQIEDTLTRKAGGVGLGLALVKEIIGNHHGKVWAQSVGKDRGARFIFTIPVAEKA
jgi:signal transduction histidine kinase/HAMP domain-containing protein